MNILILIFLFLSFPLYVSVAQSQNITAESEVVDALYTKDFGLVKADKILKHSFIFKNNSSKVINIKEVHTSCGCTASEVKKKRLLPKEFTFLKVTFNTKGYSGEVSQYVYLHTDDLDNPVVRYIIKANVVK